MRRSLNANTIFLAVLVLGIIARLFYLMVIPEEAYNDSLYHLNIVKESLEKQSFSIKGIDVPPPFYYSAFSSLLALSFLEINSATAKTFPFVLEALSLLLAFVLFRKIFKENFIAPLSFFSIFPWVMRFSGINYVENISLVFVFSTIYFLLELQEKKTKNFFLLLPLLFSISALSLSKLNATILAPFFFLAAVVFLYKSKASIQLIALFSIIAIFLSGFWFAGNFLHLGTIDQHIKSDAFNFGPNTGFSVQSIAANLPFYYLYFFDFPNQSAFAYGGFLGQFDFTALSVIFAAIVLPLFFCILFGFKKITSEKTMFGTCLFLAFAISFVPIIQRVAYFRLIIPVVPIIVIAFAKGFYSIKGQKPRILVQGSFLLFSIYSIALSGISAAAFHSSFSQHEALFVAISSIEENSLVMINSNMQREVGLFSERNALGLTAADKRFNGVGAQEFYQNLKEFGVTHIAKTCYKDTIDKKMVENLLESKKIQEIYADDCGAIYKVL